MTFRFLLPPAVGLLVMSGGVAAQKALEAARWRLEELNQITNKKLTAESAKRGRQLLEEGRDLCKNASAREPEAQVCIMRFQFGIKAVAMKEWSLGAELYRAALGYAEDAWPTNPMRYQMQASLATCLANRSKKGQTATGDFIEAEQLLRDVVAFREKETRQLLFGAKHGRVQGLDELLDARMQLGIVLRRSEKRRAHAEKEFSELIPFLLEHAARVRDPRVLRRVVMAAEIKDNKEKSRVLRSILAVLESHHSKRMDLQRLVRADLISLGEKDIWTKKKQSKGSRSSQIGK